MPDPVRVPAATDAAPAAVAPAAAATTTTTTTAVAAAVVAACTDVCLSAVNVNVSVDAKRETVPVYVITRDLTSSALALALTLV